MSLLLQVIKVQRGGLAGLRLDLLTCLQEHLPVLARMGALEVVDHGGSPRPRTADRVATQVAARQVLLHGGEIVPYRAGPLPARLWPLKIGIT